LFDIILNAPAGLRVLTQPTGAPINLPFIVQPRVAIVDAGTGYQ